MEVLFYESHDVYTHGFPQALTRRGHHVTVWQGGPSLETLQRYLASMRPELVLSMGWTPMHSDNTSLELLRQYCRSPGVLHVYWGTEDPTHTDVWTLPFLEKASPDAVLTISPTTVPLLRELGYAAEEMPFAADQGFHRPTPGGRPSDVVLVGTAYGETSGALRGLALNWLLQPLINFRGRVDVHGSFWGMAKRDVGFDLPASWLHPAVAYAEVPRLYTAASIVLCPQNEPNQLTGRTFEALASGGGIVLTVRTPGVQRHFEEGRHLLCTSSAEETAGQLARYMADPAARRRIANTARAEVLAHHTYDSRAETLLAFVATWRNEKRRTGRVTPDGSMRRQAVYSDGLDSAGERLRLRFTIPAFPPGLPFARARLRCFAKQVQHEGDALCISRMDGTVLGVRHVTTGGTGPYPYVFGWQLWDVTEAIRHLRGPSLELEIQAVHGLEVRWELPGERSNTWLIQYNQSAYLPRLELIWQRCP